MYFEKNFSGEIDCLPKIHFKAGNPLLAPNYRK